MNFFLKKTVKDSKNWSRNRNQSSVTNVLVLQFVLLSILVNHFSSYCLCQIWSPELFVPVHFGNFVIFFNDHWNHKTLPWLSGKFDGKSTWTSGLLVIDGFTTISNARIFTFQRRFGNFTHGESHQRYHGGNSSCWTHGWIHCLTKNYQTSSQKVSFASIKCGFYTESSSTRSQKRNVIR